MRLFAITAGLLFLPKLLAALLLLVKREQRRWFGGGAALTASLVLEMLFSALLAPVRMLFHTRFVISALLGIAIQWKSPPRADSQTPWGEALRRHGAGTALGGAWLYGVYRLNPDFITWLIPVAGALLISIPISVFSSRVGWGRVARAARLFLIPEEAAPPRELRRLRVLLRSSEDYGDGFRRAIRSPLTNALVIALAPTRLGRVPVTRETVQAASLDRLDTLDVYARNRLLSDRSALQALHRKVWLH